MNGPQLLGTLWRSSPQSLVAAVTRRLKAEPRSTPAHSGYRLQLVQLFGRFVRESFPDALGEDEFVELLLRHQESTDLRASNRYLGDLWRLFQPDYRTRMDEYYASFALHSTMTALGYARDEAFIEEHYVRPYRIAQDALGTFSILEVGPAIPHGFLVCALEDRSFCTRLTINEIDAPYSRFTAWFCAQRGIPFSLVPALAARSTRLPDEAFDFVFAKDVFEHLLDPKAMLAEVIRTASERAVLALDLDDKGEAVYQHVSPQLAPLADLVRSRGFTEFARSGSMRLFRRGG